MSDVLLEQLILEVTSLRREVEALKTARVIPSVSKRGTMWHDESIVTTGNAISRVHDAAQNYGIFCYQNAAANADSFTNGCYLRTGTYAFYVLGATYNTRGIIDWALDGVAIVADQDWYSAGVVYNVIKSTASIAVTFDGWHVLQGTIDGKNGSSTDYQFAGTKMWFEPAAD